jgi:LmbE family N-acetylglucosaminyl deacetylase
MTRSTPELLKWLAAGGGQAPALALVAAHPDDETVGAGARLPRLAGAHFICVTDGAPRDPVDREAAGCATRADYARRRREELAAALALAGAAPGRLHQLNVADQEASLNLVALVYLVADIFRRARLDAVVTHPYEGGHPDHDATALVVHAACRLLEASGRHVPAILEMTSYHANGDNMEAGTFLADGAGHIETGVLSDDERAFKAALFDCYSTQRRVLSGFPIDVERFRAAPRYDFTRPPHPGKLYYENFPWRMDGARWRELARGALEELGVA